MCGILFYLSKNNNLLDNNISSNLNYLKKRGPDYSDSIFFEKNNFNYFFGHTRLSILDVS